MKYHPIDPQLFTANRENLKRLLLPNALAVVQSNDLLPTNADGSMLLRPHSDLFYLTGIEQEESILLLYPRFPRREIPRDSIPARAGRARRNLGKATS